MDISLTFRSVTVPVLNAVLIECHRVRNDVRVNLADGPAWAPQVHVCGCNADGPLYNIYTPHYPLHAAALIVTAADLVLTTA